MSKASRGFGPTRSDGGERQHRQPQAPAAPRESREPATAPPVTRLRATPERTVIWGFHAVLEALRSPRRKPLRLFATEAAAARIVELGAGRGLEPVILPGAAIDALLPRDAVHQGLVLETRPLEPLDLSDLPDAGTLLVLDQITDPHNVGALMRTAAAFGVAALVTTERHAPEMTGVLAKSASGGLEHVPVVEVTNLARALDQLAKRGYQLIGLDSDGAVALEDVALAPARALVLGAEGKGMRRLTRERCEVVARLDMPGAIKSLNVSNACAVALTILRLRAPG
jgi:23S rRNA (guanosine2251-2'-O)-methyltransferase